MDGLGNTHCLLACQSSIYLPSYIVYVLSGPPSAYLLINFLSSNLLSIYSHILSSIYFLTQHLPTCQAISPITRGTCNPMLAEYFDTDTEQTILYNDILVHFLSSLLQFYDIYEFRLRLI